MLSQCSRVNVLFLIFLVVVCFGVFVNASSGDRLEEFIDCKGDCISTHCSPTDPSKPLVGSLPLHLRLLLWDCPSECDYTCQRQVTNRLRAQGLPLHQFHGKWPFLRLWGIQEPCSVIFSILNFHGHYRGIHLISQRIHDFYPLKPYYVLLGVFGMNAWVWSSVFHIRDFIFTERADYFSAAASIMYGLFYTALRIFDVHTRDMKVVQPYIYAWGGLCTILFLAHVSYLSFVTFSYSYNMAANVAVGMIQNAMWIYFSITRSKSNRGHWVWIPVYVVVYVCFAMSLEIFDFFPIADALDAHALWHLATVPMTYLFYDFLLKDTEYEIHNSRAFREKL